MIVYPALRGKFGTTEYFVVTMRVSDLVKTIQFPSELKDWDDYSLEEQFQRKLDQNRIRRHIVPYFRDDEKRFSSSIVVAAQDYLAITFETVRDVAKSGLLAAYANEAHSVGFLTIRPQKFIPLDGQHRVRAFQNVLNEDDGVDLGNDMVSVIIINFDKSLARYIFNKINKYAKPTSKAGKLITDDDDSLAVITRWLISEKVIPRRLVNVESSSLNEKSYEFTLLSTFYDANKVLLSILPVPVVGRTDSIGDRECARIQKELKKEWKLLFSGISDWKKMLEDPSSNGDKERMNMRSNSILGRPIGQLALVKGYANACSKGIDKNLVIERLNMIDWDMKNGMWSGLLVKKNGSMMFGVRVANMASHMISHLAGVQLTSTIQNKLLDYIYGTNRTPNKRLPTPMGRIKRPKQKTKIRRGTKNRK